MRFNHGQAGLVKTPTYNDFAGGLNIRETANAIKDNECRVAKNCYFLGKGVNKRAGWTKLATAAVGTAGNLIGVYQGTWIVSSVLTRYVVATDGVKIFWLNGTSWTDITGALTLTPTTTSIVSFMQMSNLLVGYDGTNAPWKWDAVGAAALALGGTPPVGNIGIVWQNRTFWAGVAAARTRLYYSALGDPESYPAANYIDVPSAFDGDPITGLAILYGALIIFKRNSIYILQGDSPDTWVLSKTNSSVGCASPYSTIAVGNLIYFVSDKGLYAMNLTNNRQVSYKVEPTYNTAIINQLGGSLTKNRIMALHYRKLNQIWVALDASAAGQDHHDRVMVHDYNTVDEAGDPAVSEFWKAGTETAPSVMADYVATAGTITPIASFYDKYVYYLGTGTNDSTGLATAVGGTSTSAASPATTTAGGNMRVNLNGDGLQTIAVAANVTGVAIAADIQAKVRALTAVTPANQAAYDSFTCTYTSSLYVCTSGSTGFSSSCVIRDGLTADVAAALKLGVTNLGTEVSGDPGYTQISLTYTTKYWDFGDPFALKTIRSILTTGIFSGGAPKFGMTISNDIGTSSSGGTYQPTAGTWFGGRSKLPGSVVASQSARYFQFTFTSDDGGLFQLFEHAYELIWKGRRA